MSFYLVIQFVFFDYWFFISNLTILQSKYRCTFVHFVSMLYKFDCVMKIPKSDWIVSETHFQNLEFRFIVLHLLMNKRTVVQSDDWIQWNQKTSLWNFEKRNSDSRASNEYISHFVQLVYFTISAIFVSQKACNIIIKKDDDVLLHVIARFDSKFIHRNWYFVFLQNSKFKSIQFNSTTATCIVTCIESKRLQFIDYLTIYVKTVYQKIETN